MVREQNRKKLNVLTFLIETIPPAKDPDVEFSENKTNKMEIIWQKREHDSNSSKSRQRYYVENC